MEERIRRLREAKVIAALGGGEEKIAKEHEKGKLTARERIDLLLDPGSFNKFNMLVKYKIWASGDGIVIGQVASPSRLTDKVSLKTGLI